MHRYVARHSLQLCAQRPWCSPIQPEHHVDVLVGGSALRPAAKDKLTTPFMTRYELARVLGTRAQQIASGAPIHVEVTADLKEDPLNIAAKELRAGMLDLIVRRRLPNGQFEEWEVKDLIVDEEDL